MGGLKRGRPPVRKVRFSGWSVEVGIVALVAPRSSVIAAAAAAIAAIARGPERLVGIVAALAEVLGLDVADVQEAVAADAEIDEGRLDARLQVDDDAFIDVADVAVLPRALHVQLFQGPVFHDRDPAFLRLRDIDQHFLFHGLAFFGKTDERAFERQTVGGWGLGRHESISTSLRVRTIPSCSRSSRPSAANTSRGPALPPGSVFNRICKPSSPSASARSEAAEVDRRGTIGTPDQRVDAESNRWIRSSSPGKRDTGTAIW